MQGKIIRTDRYAEKIRKKQNNFQHNLEVPPKPQFGRPYATRMQIHLDKKAQTFIKAMMLLANESEQLIKKYYQNNTNNKLNYFFKDVPEKWRFGNLFTGSISNFNISAPFLFTKIN